MGSAVDPALSIAHAFAMKRLTGVFLLFSLAACGGDGPSEEGASGANAGLRFQEIARSTKAPPALQIYPVRSGGTLPVRHYVSTGGDALIVLHGSGYHSAYLGPLGEPIARSGAAHVYTPDLRGHGLNPERRGDVDFIDQMEEDLADLVAWVKSRHPEGRVFVSGHSSGGGLALRFAGGPHSEGVAGFILMAPYLSHDAPTLASDSVGGWARPKIARIVFLSILNGFGVHAFDDMVEIEFAMPESVRDGTETLAYSHRLNVGYAPRDWQADLAAAPAPILVLVGKQDEAFLAEAFPAAIQSGAPSALVELMDDATHLGLPGDPRTAARILRWMRDGS